MLFSIVKAKAVITALSAVGILVLLGTAATVYANQERLGPFATNSSSQSVSASAGSQSSEKTPEATGTAESEKGGTGTKTSDLHGIVLTIGTGTFDLKATDKKYIVKYTTTTNITNDDPKGTKILAVGQTVKVEATANADGTYTAQSIEIDSATGTQHEPTTTPTTGEQHEPTTTPEKHEPTATPTTQAHPAATPTEAPKH